MNLGGPPTTKSSKNVMISNAFVLLNFATPQNRRRGDGAHPMFQVTRVAPHSPRGTSTSRTQSSRSNSIKEHVILHSRALGDRRERVGEGHAHLRLNLHGLTVARRDGKCRHETNNQKEFRRVVRAAGSQMQGFRPVGRGERCPTERVEE